MEAYNERGALRMDESCAYEEHLSCSPFFFTVATYGVEGDYARRVVESLINRVDFLQQTKGYAIRSLYVHYLGTEHTESGYPLLEITFTGDSGVMSTTHLSFSGSWRTTLEDFLWVKREVLGST